MTKTTWLVSSQKRKGLLKITLQWQTKVHCLVEVSHLPHGYVQPINVLGSHGITHSVISDPSMTSTSSFEMYVTSKVHDKKGSLEVYLTMQFCDMATKRYYS